MISHGRSEVGRGAVFRRKEKSGSEDNRADRKDSAPVLRGAVRGDGRRLLQAAARSTGRSAKRRRHGDGENDALVCEPISAGHHDRNDGADLYAFDGWRDGESGRDDSIAHRGFDHRAVVGDFKRRDQVDRRQRTRQSSGASGYTDILRLYFDGTNWQEVSRSIRLKVRTKTDLREPGRGQCQGASIQRRSKMVSARKKTRPWLAGV